MRSPTSRFYKPWSAAAWSMRAINSRSLEAARACIIRSARALRRDADLRAIPSRDVKFGAAFIDERPRQRQVVGDDGNDVMTRGHHGESKSAGGVRLHRVGSVQHT